MNVRILFAALAVGQIVYAENCSVVTGLDYQVAREYTKTRYGFKDYRYLEKVNSGDPNQRVKWFQIETITQDLHAYTNLGNTTFPGYVAIDSDYTRNVSITAWITNTTTTTNSYSLRLLDKSGLGSTYSVLDSWSGQLNGHTQSPVPSFNNLLYKTGGSGPYFQGAAVVSTVVAGQPVGSGTMHSEIIQGAVLNVGSRIKTFSDSSSSVNPDSDTTTNAFSQNYTSINTALTDETHLTYNDFQIKAADVITTKSVLSQPYTDEHFYDLTQQGLNTSTLTNGATSSSYHLNTDGSSLTLRSVPFVLTVRGEPGVEYTVEWLEKFIPDSGVTAQETVKRSTNFVGTGEDLRMTNNLTPPTANGTKVVELITPLCGACAPGDEQVKLHSVDISIPLGAMDQSRSAGMLMVTKSEPASGQDISDLYSPAILKYGPYVNENDGGVYLYKVNGAIAKFRSPQLVGDVWKHSDNKGFTILCYYYGQPNVTIPTPVPTDLSQIVSTNSSAVPYIILQFRNPDTSNNKLSVLVTRDKGTANEVVRSYTYTYESSPNPKWTLATTDLSAEIHSKVISTTANGEKTIETITTEDPTTSNVVEKTVLEKVKYTGTTQTLVTKKTVNPDGKKADGGNSPLQPLITTLVYYGPESQPTNAPSGLYFGKLALTLFPGGSWVSNVYNPTTGRLDAIVSQYLNSTVDHPEQSKITEYYYTSVDSSIDDGITDQTSPRTVIHKIQGIEVAREYYVYGKTFKKEIRCTAPQALITETNKHLTTITYLKSNSPFAGTPIKTVNPDGTAQFTTFTLLSGGDYARVTTAGEPKPDGTGIQNGIQTETIIDPVGKSKEEASYEILNGNVGVDQLSYVHVQSMDQFHRPLTTLYLDGRSTSQTYDCCGQTTFTDKDETVTITEVDKFKRRISERVEGINVKRTNVFDPAGRLTAVKRYDSTGASSSLKTLESSQYDLSGRAHSSMDALGNTTSKQDAYVSGKRVLTTTLPNQGTIIETSNGDGTLDRRTGTATFPVRFEYGVVQSGQDLGKTYTKEIKLDANGADLNEWVQTFYDALGRVCKTLYPDGAASTKVYNSKGQAFKSIDADLVTTVIYYDAQGRVSFSGIVNDPAVVSATPDPTVDRLQKSRCSFGFRGTIPTQKIETSVFKEASTNETVISIVEKSVDGQVQWDRRVAGTNFAEIKTEISYPAIFQKLIKTTQPAGDYATELFELGRLKERKTFDSAAVQLTSETFGYDSYGRQSMRTDSRNGTTTFYYNDGDHLTSTISPIPSAGIPALVSTNILDSMGQITIAILPDGTKQTNEFYAMGLLKKSTGSQRYSVEYSYTTQGRLETMKTWRDYPNGPVATTTWSYHSQRGWLTTKTYSGNAAGPSYTYKPSGRLLTKAMPRASGVTITKTYAYKATGDLWTIAYDDGTTPNVEFHYDRLGNTDSITDGAGTRTVAYDELGRLVNEPFGSYQFVVARDSKLREIKKSVMQGVTPVHVQALTYSTTSSRLDKLEDSDTSPTVTMQYSYTPNSDLVSGISFKQNGVERMFTSKTYDLLNRPLVIDSGGAISKTTLSYNSAGLIERRTERDDSYWQYTYNAQGEVQSAKRYWSDGSIVAGQQYAYAFDNIGNRTNSGEGGDEAGGGLAYTGYDHNALNQLSARRNPGVATLIGEASATATVTVNQTRTARKGVYFFGSAPANNQNGALYQQFDILGVRYDSTQQKDLETMPLVTKRKYVPPATEQFAYDLSGNLTSDGQWDYAWDGEDRLASMTSKAIPGNTGVINQTLRKKIVFNYDYLSRRTRKRVYACNSSGGFSASPELDVAFIYDRWLLVAEVESSLLVRKLFWGLDFTGGLSNAGGVGGLLAIGDSAGTSFVAFSGNGNVSTMVRASDGSASERYEYGPFGELITQNGLNSATGSLRYSTKYYDVETGLLYYGYRYYNPNVGKWLSRDPIQEAGGVNLHVANGNDSVNEFDTLGLSATAYVVDAWRNPIAAANHRLFVFTVLEGAAGASNFSRPLTSKFLSHYLTAYGSPMGLSPSEMDYIRRESGFATVEKENIRSILRSAANGDISHYPAQYEKHFFQPDVNPVDLFSAFHGIEYKNSLKGKVCRQGNKISFEGELTLEVRDYWNFSDPSKGVRRPFDTQGTSWLPESIRTLTEEEFRQLELHGYAKPFDITGKKVEAVKITVEGEKITKGDNSSIY